MLGIRESELTGIACLWMTLDPGPDWLAHTRMLQPLHCWRWQLQHVSGGARGAAELLSCC